MWSGNYFIESVIDLRAILNWIFSHSIWAHKLLVIYHLQNINGPVSPIALHHKYIFKEVLSDIKEKHLKKTSKGTLPVSVCTYLRWGSSSKSCKSFNRIVCGNESAGLMLFAFVSCFPPSSASINRFSPQIRSCLISITRTETPFQEHRPMPMESQYHQPQ